MMKAAIVKTGWAEKLEEKENCTSPLLIDCEIFAYGDATISTSEWDKNSTTFFVFVALF